jgi:pyruvate/2-oxoglutarate dehydrogenase complex dihydrolipoamide acyltransferase (E2) component
VLAPVVDVSVAGDHRALDGLVAARFLQRLAARLGDMDVNGTDHDG